MCSPKPVALRATCNLIRLRRACSSDFPCPRRVDLIHEKVDEESWKGWLGVLSVLLEFVGNQIPQCCQQLQ